MPRDLELDGRLRAEQLVVTATEREALAELRRVCGEEDGPMERHGLRCFAICNRLATDRGTDVDREVTP